MTNEDFLTQVRDLHNVLRLRPRSFRQRWRDELRLTWRGVVALMIAGFVLAAIVLTLLGASTWALWLSLASLLGLSFLGIVALVQFLRADRAAELSNTFADGGVREAALLGEVLKFDARVIEYVAQEYRDGLTTLEGLLGAFLGGWRTAGLVATASAALALFVSVSKDAPALQGYLPLIVGGVAGLVLGGLFVDSAAVPLRHRRDLLARAAALRAKLP